MTVWRHAGFGGAPFACAFFGRIGGFSRAPYDTLNISDAGEDDAGDVERNRAAVLAAMDVEGLYLPHQVHGETRVWTEAGSGVVRGVEADAALTTTRRMAVGILTADCLPVLLGDRRGRAVAAVHAGWRGLASELIGKAIGDLAGAGVGPSDLLAVVGAGIGPCHFEVSADLADRFGHQIAGGNDAVFEAGGRHFVDLPAVAHAQLLGSGVAVNSIRVIRECTYCETGRYFSYRRDGGTTGRQLSAIWLL